LRSLSIAIGIAIAIAIEKTSFGANLRTIDPDSERDSESEYAERNHWAVRIGIRNRHITAADALGLRQVRLEKRECGEEDFMPSIDRNGVKIYFEDVGSGPPVVMGHSFLCSGEMWASQVPVLAERHRVINIDERGHGRSGNLTEPFDLYDMVDDVVAVLDHLGIESAVWAGLSIGGMVAMRAAMTVAERVSGLLLLDTHAGAETRYKKLKYGVMALGVRMIGVRPFLGEISKLMFGITTRRRNTELVAAWRDRFASVDVTSMLLGLGALVRRDSVVDGLRSVEAPSLVIVGDEDASLPPKLSREIAGALPNASLVVIPEAGHLSALEKPEEVTEAMVGFLYSLS
jgi:3-oxoadipate enol-lactonase